MLQLLEGHENPVLMGEFHSGPATSHLQWQKPFNFGLIAARGFVSPYYILDGRCTYCVDNSIVVGLNSTENSLQDHIWTTTAVFRKVKHVKVYCGHLINSI